MASPAPATVDELGLQGCLYLWALLTGQQRRLPIAPTKRMTLVILALLQDQGIIEVPWPEMRWEIKPDAQITPIEGLQWRLAWTVYEPGRLLEALDDYFETLEQTDFTIAVGVRLWSDLAPAEAEHYFEQQLVKHRFAADWAQDLVVKHRFAADWAQDLAFAYREGPGAQLNIAQWRYCAWAAVRRGASVAMQNGLQADGLRDSIYQELKRRAAAVASGVWSAALRPWPVASGRTVRSHRPTRFRKMRWGGPLFNGRVALERCIGQVDQAKKHCSAMRAAGRNA